LIAFIERKLDQNNIRKVVPDDDTLAAAYRRMRRQAMVQERIAEALVELGDEDEALYVPADLKTRIEARQRADRALRWDAVLSEIAEGDHEAVADD
jgi:hypothetical protein